MNPVNPRWHLFCRVVDNFGDAGLAWRLARTLHDDHGVDVTVWIDAPDVLLPLAGVQNPGDALDAYDVAIRKLDTWAQADALPAVVIDVLGGSIPGACVEAMRRARRAPRWFVLEYLSAEAWVDDRHGLPSPHPATGLARRFWFPGFTNRTAGLLRERDLFARRDAFRADAARAQALWTMLGVRDVPPHATRVSLFCYPDAPVAALLDAWTRSFEPLVCFVPETVATEALRDWCKGSMAYRGQPLTRGALTLHVVPFVPQPQYDELLWSCDINFVRGEDSFVRAQWAATPLVWQIYRQHAGTHETKLEAFLERYTACLDDAARLATTHFWRAWNKDPMSVELATGWHDFVDQAASLRRHAHAWAATLAELPELAATLVEAAQREV